VILRSGKRSPGYAGRAINVPVEGLGTLGTDKHRRRPKKTSTWAQMIDRSDVEVNTIATLIVNCANL
jgi:hypothetical protein